MITPRTLISRIPPDRLGQAGMFLLVLGAGLALTFEAEARVGGGQNWGSGRKSGSSSGGGGGDVDLDILLLLVHLVIRYPAIGIPLILVFVGFIVVRGAWQARTVSRFSVNHHEARRPMPRTGPGIPGLTELRARDPGFSWPVLTDFIQLVQARILTGHSTGDWAALGPYVSEGVKDQLKKSLGATAVEDVVCGSIKPIKASLGPNQTRLTVIIEDVWRERTASGERTVFALVEWTFQRQAEAVSLPPETLERLGCPSCGAAGETTPMGACAVCGTPITKGQLVWQADRVEIKVRRPVVPPEVGFFAGGDEPSFDESTVVAPDLAAQYRGFQARHPEFLPKAFQDHVKAVYDKIQAAWSVGRWEDARPYLTDTMFQTMRFQVDRYRRNNLRNRLEDVVLLKQQVVKIDLDAWYEAITVRIWGSMKDSVVADNGKVVGGNASTDRRFSEYWTFVRAAGAGVASRDVDHCPSCGAPLDKISHTGICGYCDTKITTGRFGWVLSRIDPCEGYEG